MLINMDLPNGNAQWLLNQDQDVQLGSIERAASKLRISVSALLAERPEGLGGPALSARARVIAEQLDLLRGDQLRHAAAYADLRNMLDRLPRSDAPEATRESRHKLSR